MRNKFASRLLDKPYLVWTLLFIIAPLLMVVYYTFTDRSGAFSLESVLQMSSFVPTILLSVLYGLAATVICLVIGYPFAFIFSRFTTRSQRTIVLLVMLAVLLLNRLISARISSFILPLFCSINSLPIPPIK